MGSGPNSSIQNEDVTYKVEFHVDCLLGDTYLKTIQNSIMSYVQRLTKWEYRAKALVNEIKSRYENYIQRQMLFDKVQNQPSKIEALLTQAKIGMTSISNQYNDVVLDCYLDRLENLNGEA